MKLNLRAKFLLPACVLVIIGISALVTLNYMNVRDSFREIMRNDMAMACRGFAQDLSGDVAAKLRVLSVWGRSPLAAKAIQGEGVPEANAYLAD